MTNLTNKQLTEIIANDPRVEELAARLEQIEQKEQAINEVLENVDAFRDLKVHEIASICYDLEQAAIVSEYFFHDIIDGEYNYFCELEASKAPISQRVHLGQSSTFYYAPKEGFEILEEFEATRTGYEPLEILATLEYGLAFEQAALLNTVRKKECSADELDAIKNYIIEENGITEINDELFIDLNQNLEFLERDIQIMEEFTKELEFMNSYLKSYKTTENAITIVESYLTMYHEDDALNLVDVDLSTIHNSEIRKTLESMQHDVKREERKLTRDEERRLFEDAGTIHVFNSVVEDYEFGELSDDHESGYNYFYSYPKNRTVYTDEKVFVFTNNGREYMDALSAALEEFDDEGLGIDEFTTFF